jgi:hypothetical protein
MSRADSFEGGLDSVKKAFAKNNMLRPNVVFLKGWYLSRTLLSSLQPSFVLTSRRFQDTIPTLNVDALALLRLDGDMVRCSRVQSPAN